MTNLLKWLDFVEMAEIFAELVKIALFAFIAHGGTQEKDNCLGNPDELSPLAIT